MNLAFPAALILLLILPGAIFRYSYARGSWGWTSPTSFRTIWDELAYSAIFAVGLHFLWLSTVARSVGFEADFESLLSLLTGNSGAQGNYYPHAAKQFASHHTAVALYFLSLFAGAELLGKGAHALVRGTKLDLSTRTFRFKNEWFYLLTGETLSFKEVEAESRVVAGVYLSAVVDHAKESYLYRGIVQDWSFTRDGELDNVRIRDAHRRLLSADRKPGEVLPSGAASDPRYYEIRGDLFLLRYAEMKTMNLDYFSIEEEVASTQVLPSPNPIAVLTG